MRVLLSLLLIAIGGPANAQQIPGFQLTHTNDQLKWYVSTTGNVRVGRNAVLLRTLAVGDSSSFRFVSLVLASCDGTLVSTSLRSDVLSNDDTDALLPSRQANVVPVDTVVYSPPADREEKEVSKRAKALCASAGPEIRNVVLPLASFDERPGEVVVQGILTGTATRRGDVVDIWIRTSNVKVTPRMGSDGEPVKLGNRVMEERQLTGRYSLTRAACDCKQRTSGFYQLTDYQPGVSDAKTSSVDRDRLRFSPVVPGSVGETMLDSVCTLY